MTISLSCPGCGAKLKAKDALAGRRVKCPKCGHMVEVEFDDLLTLEPLPEESYSRLPPLQKSPAVSKRTHAASGIAAVRSAGQSDEEVKVPPAAHVFCAWPVLILVTGGVIGGAMGGLAYAINMAIYKSRLPLPVRIILIIAVGLGAVLAGVGVWLYLHRSVRG